MHIDEMGAAMGTGNLEDLKQALADAVTALRDLDAGYPADDLHKSVDEIVANGVALLRGHGWDLDLEPPPMRSPMPG